LLGHFSREGEYERTPILFIYYNMKNNQIKKITIIGTLAKDFISYSDSKRKSIRNGGPAHWIKFALTDLGFATILITGPKEARINIVVDKKGETGKVISVSRIPSSKIPASSTHGFFIISTVGNEYDLENIKTLEGFIALDLQGYIRLQAMEKDKTLIIKPTIQRKIDLIKITENELKNLDKALVKKQKKQMLLISKGRRGFVLFYKHHRYSIKPKLKLHPQNTLGAGDVLLASFVAEYTRCKDPQRAALFARDYVEKFLLKKPKLNKLK
jgi:hypothetical protein